jgi:hypothetical protein
MVELSWTLTEEAGKRVLVQIAAIHSARVFALDMDGAWLENSIILRALLTFATRLAESVKCEAHEELSAPQSENKIN